MDGIFTDHPAELLLPVQSSDAGIKYRLNKFELNAIAAVARQRHLIKETNRMGKKRKGKTETRH